MPQSIARVTAIALHDSGVRLIDLALVSPFEFKAGQYLNVVHPGGVRIPMSIASSPHRLPALQLHYRPLPGVPEAALMNELIASASQLRLDGPHGKVCFEGTDDDELLLIAGGTGISQCCAIVDHLDHARRIRRATLVWSVASADQLYCDARLRACAGWLDYVAVIDQPNRENAAIAWLRGAPLPRSGRLVVSGGPGFVYAVVDVLMSLGIPQHSIESDVFSYAPR